MKLINWLFILFFIVGLNFARGEEEKKSSGRWNNSISLGSTYKTGPVDKSLYTTNLKGNYYSDKIDWISSLYGTYGETDGTQTDGQLRVKSDYRYKLTGDNTFYGGLYTELYHNTISDLDLRVRMGPSLGYYFIYRDSLKFDTSAGTTITYEKAGQETKSYGSLRIAGSYDHKISDTTTYYLSAEFNISFEDSADNDGSLSTGLKTRITDKISLHIELRDQYENLRGASAADRNETTVTTGLSCNFG